MTQAAPLVIDWLSDTTLQDVRARPELCQQLFGGSDLVETLIERLTHSPDDAQWFRPAGIWMDYRWVATGGFKGPPQHGRVEIGYRVHSAYRRRGLATTLVRWLCRRAVAADLTAVLAVTTDDNQASQAVLSQLGFSQHGHFFNDQDQPLQRWQLILDSHRS